MEITITVDGDTTTEDIDIDINGLKLSEAVAVERLIGDVKWSRLMAGDVLVCVSPSTIQALIYAKIKTRFPGLGIDDFDFGLNDMGESADDDEGPVVLPMTLPDGSEVEGASEHVDPTRAASG